MNEREGKSGRMWTNSECRAFTRRAVELIRVHLYRGRYEPPSRAIWQWSGDWQRREVEEKKKELGITVSSLKIFLASVVNSYVGIDRETRNGNLSISFHPQS